MTPRTQGWGSPQLAGVAAGRQMVAAEAAAGPPSATASQDERGLPGEEAPGGSGLALAALEAELTGLDGADVAAVVAAGLQRLAGDTDALVGVVRQALAGLARDPLSGAIGEAGLVRSVEELARVERQAAAERLRRVAAVDERQAYRADGHRSVEDFLVRTQDLSRGQAKGEATTARGLRRLPRTERKLAAGELGVAQAGAAARAAAEMSERLPAHASEEEHIEVLDELDTLAAEHWTGMSAGQVKHAVDSWRGVVDDRFLVERERRAYRDRGLWLGDVETPGWLRLSQDGRAVVNAALESLARPNERGDERTQAQRTHDALVELCQRYLDAGDLPEVAAQRAHVLVTSTRATVGDHPGLAPASTDDCPTAAARLFDEHPEGASGHDPADEPDTPGRGHCSAGSWLDGVGPISATAARLIACDGEVTETVLDEHGNPLVINEPAKPTKKQRLAAIARDVVCIGCGAPAARCQLHHIVWRRHGGATVVDNLTLVCRNCHWHIHYDGYQVVTRGGRFRLRVPTGRGPADGRAPPDDP